MWRNYGICTLTDIRTYNQPYVCGSRTTYHTSWRPGCHIISGHLARKQQQSICCPATSVSSKYAAVWNTVGVVHGNLTASKCLVSTQSNVVKISDSFRSDITCGNAWRAPETYTSTATLASDIYSLGVVIWEVITKGSIPFDGKTEAAIQSEVIEGRRPTIPRGSDTLSSLVEDCWSRDPANRPQITDVIASLNSVEEKAL